MPTQNYHLRILFLLLIVSSKLSFSQTSFFDYKRYLFGTPPTVTLSIQSINTSAGSVIVNGGDSQAPTTPFTWNWGDGSITSGFFPQSHTYTDITKNYILEVTAHYFGGLKDSTEMLIQFAPSSVNPIVLSPDIAVTVPNSNVTLVSRQPGYGFSNSLSYFNNSFFTAIPRATLEYVLSVIAAIQKDFANDNVFLINDKFEQVMLRDSMAGGGYSIWYSSPIAFGTGDGFLKEPIGYSSLFHEMGHNITLNSPANYYYGGKIDGNANAIFSEAMAQIFQYASGFQIINNYEFYGLSKTLMFNIKNSVVSSISQLRSSYERYLSNGKHFASWNDPETTSDDTFDTFMTIAYKFCEQAENSGQGYRQPLKRMMSLLQGFNSSWFQQYDQNHNTDAADTFRATLMVTAVSFAFGKDLRPDFLSLNFPVSDEIYSELYNSVSSGTDESVLIPFDFKLRQNYPNPFSSVTTIEFTLPVRTFVSLKIYSILGEEIETLVEQEHSPGSHKIEWNARSFPDGIYFCHLKTPSFSYTRKLILLR
ncbi:MAG TPA: hypothetical protein DDW27_07605 [Bacteroidales bacterium]|nr:hypothetical protein [Bacteroidales bacterium]